MNKLLSKTKSLLLGVFTVMVLTACATAPTPSAIASVPVDAETASTLQLYRPNNGPVGAALDNEVYVDGILIGRLESYSRLSTKVAPGTHEIFILPKMKIIGTTTSESYKLTITVGPKEVKYVRYNVAIGKISIYGTTAVASNLTALTEVTRDDWAARR